jgi:hypothetical protein
MSLSIQETQNPGPAPTQLDTGVLVGAEGLPFPLLKAKNVSDGVSTAHRRGCL